MFSAKRLVAEFDRKFDRFDGQYKKTLRIEHKISVINEAISVYFNNRVRIAESNAQVRDDLRPYEVKEKVLKVKKGGDGYVIAEIPKDCYRIMRRRVIASRAGCGQKELPVYLFQTNDLNNAIKNPFWQSSFEWEQVIGDEGADGIYLWHHGRFDIDDVIVDYYRTPKEVQCASCTKDGSYEDYNGKMITSDVPLGFDSTVVMNDIIDISVLIARRDLGDSVDYPLLLKGILDAKMLYTT